MSNQGGSKPTGACTQEYVVRVPKGLKKKHSIMKFNAINNIDISTWNQVRMERENNAAEFKSELEDAPKFGAGSVYNNEQKMIAKKKKRGINMKHYNPEEQPWLLRVGGKTGKRYRGVKEGGVLDNASFYVFTEAKDGAFEAFPVQEWYNFQPVARYKTLNAEEAEEEFERRDKVRNYFSIMVKKRLKNEDEEGEAENANEQSAKSSKINEFKISEMDEWTDASDNEESDSENESEKKKKAKKARKVKKVPAKEKRKKKGTDDEAEEDSDEFDEGQEVDYISDDTSSSEDEAVKKTEKVKDDLKGVEDEEALRVFDMSEDEEEEKKEEEENQTENANEKEKETKAKNAAAKKADSSSDTSSDSSDSDNIDSDIKSAMFIQKVKGKNGSENSSASNSRANTPTKQVKSQTHDGSSRKTAKRKADDDSEASSLSNSKKHKADTSTIEGLSDESIRRYLMRKPITAAELFQKFKSKKCGMSDDQLATTIAAILKRMNLHKQQIKGKIYWSLKE